jgi:hypothetical protein
MKTDTLQSNPSHIGWLMLFVALRSYLYWFTIV